MAALPLVPLIIPFAFVSEVTQAPKLLQEYFVACPKKIVVSHGFLYKILCLSAHPGTRLKRELEMHPTLESWLAAIICVIFECVKSLHIILIIEPWLDGVLIERNIERERVIVFLSVQVSCDRGRGRTKTRTARWKRALGTPLIRLPQAASSRWFHLPGVPARPS